MWLLWLPHTVVSGFPDLGFQKAPGGSSISFDDLGEASECHWPSKFKGRGQRPPPLNRSVRVHWKKSMWDRGQTLSCSLAPGRCSLYNIYWVHSRPQDQETPSTQAFLWGSGLTMSSASAGGSCVVLLPRTPCAWEWAGWHRGSPRQGSAESERFCSQGLVTQLLVCSYFLKELDWH